MHVDRERVVPALTFWLRPDFLVRCLRRFQALEGFDRAIALASLTFSALIPLGIVVSGEQIQAEWAGVRRQAHEARQRVSDWRAARKQKS